MKCDIYRQLFISNELLELSFIQRVWIEVALVKNSRVCNAPFCYKTVLIRKYFAN